jgi:ABC-type branched-subunit amino acid transport system ATPase component
MIADVSTPAVSVTDVRKRYGDLWALDGATFEIAEGECFALLGPNGAGKTTVTEILEGYRTRDSGTAQVLGQDPAHGDRAWRSQLGIVLQRLRLEFGQHPQPRVLAGKFGHRRRHRGRRGQVGHTKRGSCGVAG